MLNERALGFVEAVVARADDLRVSVEQTIDGGRTIDCGVDAHGGIEAGLALARVCLAELGTVSIHPGDVSGAPLPIVQVSTDHPVRACLASQYAGWAIHHGEFFAMGSGPMRAAYGGEDLFDSIGMREPAAAIVGVLETRTLPGKDVYDLVGEKAGVDPNLVTLMVAPTASIAGGVQVVARSVETALHKLHELKFDLGRVVSGWGSDPLPPVAKGDLEAIGRTNDCVLYGGRVVLWVRGDDASLDAIGSSVPSSASPDHGAPFLEIFERYERDFYKIDPRLFSPAEFVFQNLDTGRTHRFGACAPDILAKSLFE